MKYSISDLQQVATSGLTPPPCDLTMQIKVEYAEDGVAKGIWKVDEKYINGLGVVMGGFLSSAADILMAYAIASKLTDKQGFVSIDLDTTFHRPGLEGEIEVTARVEKMGRTLAYVVADLVQNEKKIATCVSSLLIK
ncbi:PaaI family thioesterase [Ornithinibacillus californiensis]|uniref:PaaI family thioesterase n=1 Tax=Ornithinibacillus californiensis TaxID=161536 RepID=UPI001F46CB52|nr:PaaI family thioesterase [Ornithinibacillus californiensis]